MDSPTLSCIHVWHNLHMATELLTSVIEPPADLRIGSWSSTAYLWQLELLPDELITGPASQNGRISSCSLENFLRSRFSFCCLLETWLIGFLLLWIGPDLFRGVFCFKGVLRFKGVLFIPESFPRRVASSCNPFPHIYDFTHATCSSSWVCSSTHSGSVISYQLRHMNTGWTPNWIAYWSARSHIRSFLYLSFL